VPNCIELVREDETEACFACRSFVPAASAIIGWTCAALALFYFDGAQRWLYFTLMTLLGAVGTWGGLWRDEIDLNIVDRRYSRRRGFWPAVEKQEGSFDQIQGIFLATETRLSSARSNRVYTVWVVRLALPGEKEGLTVLSFDDEIEAIRRLKTLSLNLHLPVIDSPVSLDKPSFLGSPLIETVAGGANGEDGSAAVFSWRPPGGRITLAGRMPNRTIDLPTQKGIGTIFFLTIPAVLCLCVSLDIFLAKIVGIPLRHDSPREILQILVLSCVVGAGLIGFGLARASVRERIEEDGDSLRFRTLAFGRSVKLTTLKIGEIVGISVEPAIVVSGRGKGAIPSATSVINTIALSPGTGKQEQIVVRSASAVVRLGVQLKPAERTWLREALLSMVAGIDVQ
jgi:hypothetical protein